MIIIPHDIVMGTVVDTAKSLLVGVVSLIIKQELLKYLEAILNSLSFSNLISGQSFCSQSNSVIFTVTGDYNN